MATSRPYGKTEQSARLKRIHRVPGHLDDFVLAYPAQKPNTVFPVTDRITSTPRGQWKEVDPETDRWQRMEQCVMQVQELVRMLTTTLQMSLDVNKIT